MRPLVFISSMVDSLSKLQFQRQLATSFKTIVMRPLVMRPLARVFRFLAPVCFVFIFIYSLSSRKGLDSADLVADIRNTTLRVSLLII
jgi:hypothetical protein